MCEPTTADSSNLRDSGPDVSEVTKTSCESTTEKSVDIRTIRMRIGRTRRRMDRRVNNVEAQGRRLTSWKTYLAQFPISGLGIAFGFGLALTAGLSGRRLLRWAGMRIFRQSVGGFSRGLVDELSQIWADSRPTKEGRQ
jgi:ElaB/YqjD/DUF883 family membrane-anchored ribosome-binding protein